MGSPEEKEGPVLDELFNAGGELEDGTRWDGVDRGEAGIKEGPPGEE